MAKQSISFDFPDAKELQRKLLSLEPKVAGSTLRTGVFRAAQFAALKIKAVIGRNGSVRTGRLISSVQARRRSNRPGETMSSAGPKNVPYAHLVDLGHKHPRNLNIQVKAKAFMGPAFVESKDEIDKIVREYINQTVNQGLK